MSDTLSLPVRHQSRHLHVLHVLIRHVQEGTVRFLVYPHRGWKKPDGSAYWALPAKKTVVVPEAAPWNGQTVEPFIDAIMRDDLGLHRTHHRNGRRFAFRFYSFGFFRRSHDRPSLAFLSEIFFQFVIQVIQSQMRPAIGAEKFIKRPAATAPRFSQEINGWHVLCFLR